MAEVQLDVASANRFINSLSKSLQALCHGCMDFDAGIEIVGFININIDSGSKVNYVLNEKVLKSTTNSMTFVSNSFLAQKDQPKTTKDGSCSPIPELNYPSYKSSGGFSNPASQMYRSSGIYSPHSQVLRGSQKRSWSGGDWRTSPRKFPRGAKSQYGSFHHQSSSHNDSFSYSNQMPAESNPISSQQSSYTSQQEYEGSGTQSDVSIKKEVEENTEESNVTSGDQNNDTPLDNVNIKADPDSLPGQEDSTENSHLGTAKSEADVSTSFLQSTTNNETAEEDSGTNQEHNVSNYEDSSFNLPGGESSGTGNNSEQFTIDNPNEDSQGAFGNDGDFDESGEMYNQSSYSGEGPSGSGQFEVIEIDDEDEDVAAMFNDPKESVVDQTSFYSLHPPILTQGLETSIIHPVQIADGIRHVCSHCSSEFADAVQLHRHICQYHGETMLYNCGQCKKGFMTSTGLRLHEEAHGERKFVCHVCDNRFKHKHHLKSHLLRLHQLRPCVYCDSWFALNQFETHVASCMVNKLK